MNRKITGLALRILERLPITLRAPNTWACRKSQCEYDWGSLQYVSRESGPLQFTIFLLATPGFAKNADKVEGKKKEHLCRNGLHTV